MSVYYEQIAGIGLAFPASPQIDLTGDFEPSFWRVFNADLTNALEYSFDGINAHGHLAPSATANAINSSDFLPVNGRKIWIRAAAGTVTARIQAFS